MNEIQLIVDLPQNVRMYPIGGYKQPSFEEIYPKPKVWQQAINNPEICYRYARDIIKGRWPEGEKTIATSSCWACEYAIYIVRGRWPEGEKIIATSATFAYSYARHVIKGRWKKAEKIISKSSYAREYEEEFIKPGSREARRHGRRKRT